MYLVVAAGVILLAACVYLLSRNRREVLRLRKRLETTSAELEHLQTSFARFAPSEVVEHVISTGESPGGQTKEVTVLFADLVDFTKLSESLDPEVLVNVLNRYFTRMSRAITDHRGHVSKFIGDGILALFGALGRNPWQSDDAVHAALAMQAALADYNQELVASGYPALRVGVGVNRGEVIAGVIGSHELMEFTVIGHHVNLAARIERLTRDHDADILVTAAVREALDSRFVLRELPPVAIRGISAPVVPCAVEGFRDEGT